MKVKEVEFQNGEKGWFGQYGSIIIPAYPGQTKDHVLSRITAIREGKAKFFRI